MTVVALHRGRASARVSPRGGSVLGLSVGGVPLLRPADDDASPLASACYPLVPFGNRVRGNAFRFDGETYRLTPNMSWDAHYLHGEGWLDDWRVDSQAADRVGMTHAHDGSRIPYSYTARQDFVLTEFGMVLELSVTNTGPRAMPFGLGWHPYVPMTPQTTLEARTGRMWTEEEGWLPGEPVALPAELNFAQPQGLPMRWLNNAFEDWSGAAIVRWPERGAAMRVNADPLFSTLFLFVSDTTFDPTYRRDFFALEPMSHLPDGHNHARLGGLRVLAPGESLAGAVSFAVEDL
jgi:aldose 1-epimerase